MEGFVHALDRFDPPLGNALATFASWHIRQAINKWVDECAGLVRVPSGLRGRHGRLQRARAEFVTDVGREPSDVELAGFARVPLAVVERDSEIAWSSPSSLDATVSADGGGVAFVELIEDDGVEPADARIARVEREALARELLESLPERERSILNGRFGFDGPATTLSAIGVQRGVSRERVRQLQEAALDRLRLVVARQGAGHAAE